MPSPRRGVGSPPRTANVFGPSFTPPSIIPSAVALSRRRPESQPALGSKPGPPRRRGVEYLWATSREIGCCTGEGRLLSRWVRLQVARGASRGGGPGDGGWRRGSHRVDQPQVGHRPDQPLARVVVPPADPVAVVEREAVVKLW